MKPSLEAVVFDADGTLLDTREFILAAYEHVLEAHGVVVPSREFIASHMGLPLHACYEAFAPRGDIDSMSEMHRLYQENNLSLIGSYEGLILTLDTLRNHGYKIGICSSRRAIDGHLFTALERAGIRAHCDVVIGGEHVERHKPDPEGFLKAVSALGTTAEQTAMVGDTMQDIEAGKNGGAALTVAVTHGFGTRESLEEAGADHIVDRLADIIPVLVP